MIPRLAFICILATLLCGSTVSSQNAQATELPELFENMTVRYDCSASVKMHDGSVVFNMTARYVDTVIEVNENASIELAFTLVSMNGEMPTEVSNAYFPLPLESRNTTIEVPVAQPMQSHYWSIFLDEDLFADYKAWGYFLGEENFDTEFGTVGTYHVQKVGANQRYDVFYDKATGWVVYVKETYIAQGQIYTVTYSIEMAETNASLSPPVPSTFPYSYLLIAGILLSIVVAASVFFYRKRRQRTDRDIEQKT